MKSVMLAPNDSIDDVINKYGLVFPMYASPKIDGLRAANRDMSMLTRSMKEHKNVHIQGLFAYRGFHGLDGELTVGDPWDPNCFDNTDGICRQKASKPDVVLNVFDNWAMGDRPYKERLEWLKVTVGQWQGTYPHIRLVEQKLITSYEEMDEYEAEQLGLGYEGIMIRNPDGLYKPGRCTAKERNLLKVKRFVHGEARIVGCEELMVNENEAFIAENGMQRRSTHQENLVPGGTLGAIRCIDLVTGEPFKVGTGFTAKQRADLWARFQSGDEFANEVLRYKHFPHGRKDAPRHPVFAFLRGLDESGELM